MGRGRLSVNRAYHRTCLAGRHRSVASSSISLAKGATIDRQSVAAAESDVKIEIKDRKRANKKSGSRFRSREEKTRQFFCPFVN